MAGLYDGVTVEPLESEHVEGVSTNVPRLWFVAGFTSAIGAFLGGEGFS
jgi:hypothetical protein